MLGVVALACETGGWMIVCTVRNETFHDLTNPERKRGDRRKPCWEIFSFRESTRDPLACAQG